MLVDQWGRIALALVLLGAVATSAGYLTHALAVERESRILRSALQTPVAEHQGDAVDKPAPWRMFVVGRVLDPQGKPVAGARVMASARVKMAPSGTPDGLDSAVIGSSAADESGRFRLDVPRTSSSRNDEFMAIALAPGYGAGWARIDPDAEQPAADIS